MASNPMYAKNVTGDYSAAASWSATGSGGADSVGPPSSSTDIIFDSGYTGNITIAANVAAKTLVVQAGAIGTLTHGDYTLTVSGSATFVPGFNYVISTSSTIGFSGASVLTTGGLYMPSLTLNSGGFSLGDNIIFGNITSYRIAINTTFSTAGKNVSGYSSTSRILIRANVLGNPKEITVTGTTFANADFRDIIFNNGGNDLDLSAITGLSGNCGGNSNVTGGKVVTFTSAVNPTTVTGNSANWSAATWDIRVPLPQDNVVINLTAGQTLTVDMSRIGKNISFGTATKLTINKSVTSYGNVDLTGMGTYIGGFSWTLDSWARSGTQYLTSAGFVPPTVFTFNFATYGATLQIQDATTFGIANTTHTLSAGTLDANDNTITFQKFAISGGTLLMGNGSWVCPNSSGSTIWNVTGGTVISEGSTISITNTGANQRIFAGGTSIFNNLSTPSGSGGVKISGDNSFNLITSSAGGKIDYTTGSTQIIRSTGFFGFGNGANALTLESSSAGNPWALTVPNGILAGDYLTVTDGAITSGTAYYGSHGSGDAYSQAHGWASFTNKSVNLTVLAMTLTLFGGTVVIFTPPNTYLVVSSTNPDLLDVYVDGSLVWRFST